MNVGALLSTRTVVLNDGVTEATIYPVWDGSQLPLELVASLWVEYNAEIDRGCSFPETHKLMLDTFEKTWFAGVAGVMVRGGPATSLEDLDFLSGTACLGSFYIEPCYPGRSSHLCTAKFLVNSRMRSRGIGLRLASCFMEWAPRLGYDYALFKLVYATNKAFCKILERLRFRALFRLRGAGILNGYDYPVDALQYGRALLVDEYQALQPPDTFAEVATPAAAAPPVSAANVAANASLTLPTSSPQAAQAGPDPDLANIKVYLETGAYPENSTRVEKTRLRSRARSYYVENHQLMFKRTKTMVVADPQDQLRIATEIHRENHNGINNVQRQISAKYHWSGMRETITRAIHQCPECRAATLLTNHSTSAVPQARDSYNQPHQLDQYGAAPQSSPQTTYDAGRDQIGEKLDREGLSLNADVAESPHGSRNLKPPRDPYASDRFRWENVVYLPPEQDDDEYVPETDPDFDFAAAGSKQTMSDLFQDDDVDFNEDEDEDDEYIDDGQDDEAQDDDGQDDDGRYDDGQDDDGQDFEE